MNDDWSMRKKITIDTSASGANITDQIGTQAVLVRLHAGNFRFARAKEDGSDLRFVAGDDKTPLKFHIEGYEFVARDRLRVGSGSERESGREIDIWLYYGNKKANAIADAKGTYDARRCSSIISTSMVRRRRISRFGAMARRAPASPRTARSSAPACGSMAAIR